MHNKQSIKQLIKELDFQKRQAENILSKILLPILITSKKQEKQYMQIPMHKDNMKLHLNNLQVWKYQNFIQMNHKEKKFYQI